MIAPPFMSKLKNQKRTSVTKPGGLPDVDEINVCVDDFRPGPSSVEDKKNALEEYKKCMDEVMSEYQFLSTGAMQQMALERRAKMIEERRSKDAATRRKLGLRGIMSKLNMSALNIGSNDHKAVAGEDDIGTTIALESAPVLDGRRITLSKHQSLMSVAGSDRSLLDISGKQDEEDLEDSLKNIEKSHGTIMNVRTSRPNNRSSRRISEISIDLSDVDEDKELHASTGEGKLGAPTPGKDESILSAQETTQLVQSNKSSFPDEIEDVIHRFGTINQGSSFLPLSEVHCLQSSDRSLQTDQESSDTTPMMRHQRNVESSQSKGDDSRLSSLSAMSWDSANFKGDFSAWSSSRRFS